MLHFRASSQTTTSEKSSKYQYLNNDLKPSILSFLHLYHVIVQSLIYGNILVCQHFLLSHLLYSLLCLLSVNMLNS